MLVFGRNYLNRDGNLSFNVKTGRLFHQDTNRFMNSPEKIPDETRNSCFTFHSARYRRLSLVIYAAKGSTRTKSRSVSTYSFQLRPQSRGLRSCQQFAPSA